ncbi:RagB/SusD family protein [Paradesertivirga mongoliensis]|uniref:RagB/SusD family protein n=1 Tax=Paradesertivirga mongoliensis TaxID=2100740 RepID=A0ABW4ZJN6_9SPHI|nr:RagB/SusD family protein [Pedobacter mongoliensis]
MKRNIRSLFTGVLSLMLVLSTLSCKKMFDISPEDALEYDKNYQNVNDADAAVWGIYGKFVQIADRYMVLNELRGDLEDVTLRSTKYIREINDHNVSADNPWADPKPFYEIIINCNDVLSNFDKMLADTRLSQADYDIRYSEIGAVRTWVYLQLGIHYGSIPYVTDPLTSIKDVQDESKYPRISFDQLLTNLTQFAEALPNKDPITSGSLFRTLDGNNTRKMMVNKYLLLGDLYLWKQNWQQAAVYYQKMMNYADVERQDRNSEQWYETYKVSGWRSQLVGGNWDDMFSAAYNERYSNYNIIWQIPFSKGFAPQNPFIALYSASEGYQIKASNLAIQNWDNQTRIGNSLVDVNRGAQNSYRSKALPEIIKLIPNYNPQEPFETAGKWILYRAPLLHLRMAEAANQVGLDSISDALLNIGIQNTFRPASLPSNRTNIMQTVKDVNSPFYFDARNGDAPTFRAPWYRNDGIRGSNGLLPAKVDSASYFDMSNPGDPQKPFTDEAGFRRAMEDLLLEEAALELAFEGNRWPDLLRTALRRKTTDPNYLANKIAAKFEAKGDGAGAAAVRARLSNEANWYLPFKM